MLSSALLRAALLGFAITQASAGDTAWQIHLDRFPAPGDRCSVSATGSQDRHVLTTTPGQPKENTGEHLEITYAAIHQVLAVDAAGHPREMLLRIDQLLTNDGSGPIEQFAAGTRITATADGDKTLYRLGRDLLEGTLCDALDMAGAKLLSANEPSEDSVFQNHRLRQPGEEWTADPKRLADAIAATSPFVIDSAASSAVLRFDKTDTENNIPVLATTTTFKIIPTGFRNATGTGLTDSNITSTTQRLFPIDPALPMLRETVGTSMKLLQKSNPGPRATTTETTLKREVTRRYLPLPRE